MNRIIRNWFETRRAVFGSNDGFASAVYVRYRTIKFLELGRDASVLLGGVAQQSFTPGGPPNCGSARFDFNEPRLNVYVAVKLVAKRQQRSSRSRTRILGASYTPDLPKAPQISS